MAGEKPVRRAGDAAGPRGGATSRLRRVGAAADAEASLVAAFFDELRALAEAEIGRSLQARVGASDIANAAIRSALSEVGRRSGEDWSTERFRGLARTIARRKIIDEAREARAGRRDVAREQRAVDARREAAGDADDPAARAAAAELATLCQSTVLLRVGVGDMAWQKRLVAALALAGNTPAQIHDVLRQVLPPDGEDAVPSLRLVQLVAKTTAETFEAEVDRLNADAEGGG